jgi:hypothetical protein
MSEQIYKAMEQTINKIALLMGFDGDISSKCEKINQTFDVVVDILPEIKQARLDRRGSNTK